MPEKNKGVQYGDSNVWVPKNARHVMTLDYSGFIKPVITVDGKKKVIVIYSGEG